LKVITSTDSLLLQIYFTDVGVSLYTFYIQSTLLGQTFRPFNTFLPFHFNLWRSDQLSDFITNILICVLTGLEQHDY